MGENNIMGLDYDCEYLYIKANSDFLKLNIKTNQRQILEETYVLFQVIKKDLLYYSLMNYSIYLKDHQFSLKK